MSAATVKAKSGAEVILEQLRQPKVVYIKRGPTCKEVHCRQKDDVWWSVRRGVPTASEAGRILTPKTMKYASAAKKYITDLAAEIYRLDPKIIVEKPISRDMQFGVDCEPEARAWFASETGLNVREVGFCMTDDERFGCSPDGLIDDDGCLELKCPKLETLSAWLLDDGDLCDPSGVPYEHLCQVHDELIVTNRKYCSFVAYSPGLHPLHVRVTPNEFTDKLREAKELLWANFMKAIDKLYAIGNKRIVP